MDPIDGEYATEEQILEATKGLLGATIGDIDKELSGWRGEDRVYSKQGVADVIEKGYFGLSIDSSPKPDFTGAGIELKVTPLRTTGEGRLVRPKERLVLCMVDYESIHGADHWTEINHLRDKMEKVLIIWYIHLKGKERSEYPIVWYHLWEPAESELWREGLQKDFLKLKEAVEAGESPSEKLTDYLGTCPKHGGGYNKENPEKSRPASYVKEGSHPVLDYAEKRGWSISVGGMFDLLQYSTNLDIKSVGRSSGISLEELEGLMLEESGEEMKVFRKNESLSRYVD